MKSFLKVLCLYVLCVSLIGCGNASQSLSSDQTEEPNIITTKIITEGNYDLVTIFNKKTTTKIEIEDEEEINALQSILLKASKQPGIANVAEHHYEIELYDYGYNVERIYVWLGEAGQRSALMNAKDTHTIYVVLEKGTAQLTELLQ